MNTYAKITALYERLSIGDEQRGGEDSSSIKSQKEQLEQYAKQHGFANIRHYTDDDESGRFFDRTGYSQMMEDVEGGKIGVVIMKDAYVKLRINFCERFFWTREKHSDCR